MIVRTQVTFSATGECFTPSKVAVVFSRAHDPGSIGKRGRYRDVPVPYGSASLDAPEYEPEKIAFVHRHVHSSLDAMRAAGAESFCLHITYQYESQCALSFSEDELKMISELGCYLNVDCWTEEEPNQ